MRGREINGKNIVPDVGEMAVEAEMLTSLISVGVGVSVATGKVVVMVLLG